MAKYMVSGEFEHYHGEGINPKHLSTWERWVLKWHRHYDPALDADHLAVQKAAAALHKAKQAEYMINKDLKPAAATAAGKDAAATDRDVLPPTRDTGSAANV